VSQAPLLSVENLAFERDDSCLFSGVNFAVAAGDILQVEGANGSGKTTLLRLLTGSLQSSAGNIAYLGQALSACRYDYLSDMLYIGHQPAVKPNLSAEENLRWMVATSAQSNDISVTDALTRVGLAGYSDIPCYALSAGQHRRVALARLLISEARLWYLDEPFTSIDKQGVAFLQSCLQQHVAKGGAVILSTHQDLALTGLRKYKLLPHAEGSA
jgi:heme exporter protein A